MIAVTLGLLLSGAVIFVFLGSKQSYNKTNGGSSLIDSARFSTDFMNRALRSTGFIGCAAAPSVTTTGPTTPNVLFDFGNTVDGYEATGTGNGGSFTLASPPVSGDSTTGDWSPALPSNFSVTTTNPLTGVATTSANGLQGLAVKNSDILVVHSTLQNSQGSTQIPSPVVAFASDNLTITNATGMQAGQVAVVSDCSKAVTFQISTISVASGVLNFDAVSASNSSAGTTMGNSSSTLPVSFDYAQLYLPTTSIFFIGAGTDGDGALFRGDLTLTAAGAYTLQANEIVPDVENMQILYGIDPNNTHAVTAYTTADQVGTANPTGCGTNVNGTNSFNCVDSIQVAFLVASPLQTAPLPKVAPSINFPNGITITPPRDTRQRTIYQVTVAVRNTLP
jgi:type IV pilus assembly protein PilW